MLPQLKHRLLCRLTPERRRLAGNASALLLARLVLMASRLVYLLIVARFLGEEQYGLLTYAQSWYLALMPLALFGLPTLLPRLLSLSGQEAADQAAAAQTLLLVSMPLAVIACALISNALSAAAGLEPILLLFALTLAARATVTWTETLAVAREQTHLTLLPMLIFRAAEPLLAVVLLAFGAGITALAGLHLGLWAGQALWAILITTPAVRPPPRRGPPRLWPILRSAFPLMLSSALNTWLLQGPLILYATLGGAEVGSFALIIQLMISLSLVPIAIGQSLLPALTRASQEGGRGDAWFVRRTQQILLLGGGGVAAIVGQLGPWIVGLSIGEGFTPAGRWSGVAAFLVAVLSTGILQLDTQVARGYTWIPPLANAAAVTALAVAGLLQPFGQDLAGGMTVLLTGLLVFWIVGAAMLEGFAYALLYLLLGLALTLPPALLAT